MTFLGGGGVGGGMEILGVTSKLESCNGLFLN